MTKTTSIGDIIEKDLPDIVCLLDLLSEHPSISGSNTLMGSVAAIKAHVVEAWDKLELASA